MPAQVKDISVQTLHDLLSGNPDLLLVDVRTPSEWESVRAQGAKKFIEHHEIGARAIELGAAPETPIYLICRVGERSSVAAQILAKMGFTQIFNVYGGTNAWIDAGYPTTSGPVPQPSNDK